MNEIVPFPDMDMTHLSLGVHSWKELGFLVKLSQSHRLMDLRARILFKINSLILQRRKQWTSHSLRHIDYQKANSTNKVLDFKKSKKRNWTNKTETLVYFISLLCDNVEKAHEHNMCLTQTGNTILSSLTWEDVCDTIR